MNQADLPKTSMTELNGDLAVAQAIALIKSYSFETNGNSVENLVQKWLHDYQGNWVRLAAIEALYLGRYKSVSIEQIMAVWLRIGTPNIHFKGEFERLICRKLPKYLIPNPFWLETENSLFPDRTEVKVNSGSNYLPSSQTSYSSSETYFNTESSSIHSQYSSLSLSEKEQQPKTKFGDNHQSSNQSATITNFNPIFDDSAFFDKLKSLALAGISPEDNEK
ncbi:hypothetical protein Xen7305DRAFT_00011280 [Xenococcus sp. PCC 7305]|uniref:hypothetical protein n=1 Tax=Xenococcus sp. PCC 7305 TaxID=102125 RepID=UPI0002ABE25E|nr:hypothetical protein [Xenococcus sp. PCC 7305]ELS01424.1 hypothetical protein Xen7305DRAFT_00011280 [Xenococcus sp. PCC 7305]